MASVKMVNGLTPHYLAHFSQPLHCSPSPPTVHPTILPSPPSSPPSPEAESGVSADSHQMAPQGCSDPVGVDTSSSRLIANSPSTPPPHSPSAGGNGGIDSSSDAFGLHETPTKKNKRKLSEPKKRSDIPKVKRCRADGRSGSSKSSRDSSTDDETSQLNALDRRPRSSCSETSPSPSRDQVRRLQRHPTSRSPSPSSSISSSESSRNHDADAHEVAAKVAHKSPSLPPTGLPPHFLQPAAAFGYLPPAALYFGGHSFPHPGIHPSLTALPLHFQQSYLAAAAAAAAAASGAQPSSLLSSTQSPPAPTPDLSSRSASRSSSSSTTHVKTEMSSSSTSAKASSSSAKLKQQQHHHLHQPSSSSSSSSSKQPLLPSPLPPAMRIPSVSQPTPSGLLPPHCLPSTSNASALSDRDVSSNAPVEDHEPMSPEDLSMGGGKMSRKYRKNYKNMTRERRVEANARERTRVHTISAAFDALRHAVPSYSYNQKLSKLAILRIACSYIMSLARLTDQDYTSASEHIGTPLSFAECVDMCTSTIQTEGRARRRH